jgi:hypothetical protein
VKKLIIVNKISLQSYNKLIDLGYRVLVRSQTTEPVERIRYKYLRPIKPTKPITKVKCTTGCNHSLSSACPKTYMEIE